MWAVLSDLVASPRRNLLRKWGPAPKHSSKNKSGGWGIIPVLPLWCPVTDRAGPPSTDCAQRRPIPHGDFCTPTLHLLVFILSGVEGKRKQGSSGQAASSWWLLSWSLYPAKGPAPYPHLQALDRCPPISAPPQPLVKFTCF